MGNAVKRTKAVAHFVMPKNCDNPAGVVCLLKRMTAALKASQLPTIVPTVPTTRVACFCSGSWGSGVARLVGQSLLQFPQFEKELMMWVSEDEVFEGQPLADVINSTRYDSKHLPGLRLPINLRATSNVKEAVHDADLLIFVVEREKILQLLDKIALSVKPTATAVVMSKVLFGVGGHTHQHLRFGSAVVSERLGTPTAVLMGGTLAVDVANGYFAEATLGCEDDQTAEKLLTLFNRPNFVVKRLSSTKAVELFSVMKSIVSLASGFCDGLELGSNTKAAIVRIGSAELSRFATRFYPHQSSIEALNEACGWTDIIASSYGDSRTRRCAAAFAKSGTPPKSWEEVAESCLRHGMPAGLAVVQDVYKFIHSHRAEAEFPFISKVYSIVQNESPVASLTQMSVPRVRSSSALKVTVLGSGNWGTAIGRIVSLNTQKQEEFHKTVKMWVHQEIVDGEKLTDIINTRHENVKYLSGIQLPHNLVAEPDVIEAVKDANILIFVLPHQFLPSLLDSIQGSILPDAVGVTLIKGFFKIDPDNATLKTSSQVIFEKLDIPCAVLNGANVAMDIARDQFAESTLACPREDQALLLSRLLNAPNFSVRTSSDVLAVELFGGLKNIVALAAGFADGLGLPANTKAAVLRRGLLEMLALVRELYPGSKNETILESCGFADLLTTCYGGRNRLCAEAFAKDPSLTWEEIEAKHLSGQKLQGPSACLDIQLLIDKRGLRDRFPLFTSIHNAVTKVIQPEDVFTASGFIHEQSQ